MRQRLINDRSSLQLTFFFFNATPTTEIYTLSLHDALPIGLAAGPQDLVNVLAAVHQANHTLAGLAAHDREAVGKAVAYRCLYVPTRLLPARYDVPRRYALTPKRMADALLSTYDAAVSASSEAASALDKGGGRRECPIKGPGHALGRE